MAKCAPLSLASTVEELSQCYQVPEENSEELSFSKMWQKHHKASCYNLRDGFLFWVSANIGIFTADGNANK